MEETKKYIPALKYDWLTKFYDPVVQLTMPEKKFKKALINMMAIEPSHKILDFGCGSLTLSLMGAEAHPKAEFYAIDIDEKILSMANQKLASALQRIFIQQYDGTKIPYPEKYFNHVMSSLVFHHLTLRQKYDSLKELFRVLKPSGEIHIADFGKPSDKLQRIGFYSVQLLDGFETTNDSLRNALPKAMTDCGFSEVEEKGFFKTLVGTVRLLKGVKSNKTIL